VKAPVLSSWFGRGAVAAPPDIASAALRSDRFRLEREGDELRIRPAQRRMGDVLGKLAKFSPDFMVAGRGHNEEGDREPL
jgi:virulence-associated protein VagC